MHMFQHSLFTRFIHSGKWLVCLVVVLFGSVISVNGQQDRTNEASEHDTTDDDLRFWDWQLLGKSEAIMPIAFVILLSAVASAIIIPMIPSTIDTPLRLVELQRQPWSVDSAVLTDLLESQQYWKSLILWRHRLDYPSLSVFFRYARECCPCFSTSSTSSSRYHEYYPPWPDAHHNGDPPPQCCGWGDSCLRCWLLLELNLANHWLFLWPLCRQSGSNLYWVERLLLSIAHLSVTLALITLELRYVWMPPISQCDDFTNLILVCGMCSLLGFFPVFALSLLCSTVDKSTLFGTNQLSSQAVFNLAPVSSLHPSIARAGNDEREEQNDHPSVVELAVRGASVKDGRLQRRDQKKKKKKKSKRDDCEREGSVSLGSAEATLTRIWEGSLSRRDSSDDDWFHRRGPKKPKRGVRHYHARTKLTVDRYLFAHGFTDEIPRQWRRQRKRRGKSKKKSSMKQRTEQRKLMEPSEEGERDGLTEGIQRDDDSDSSDNSDHSDDESEEEEEEFKVDPELKAALSDQRGPTINLWLLVERHAHRFFEDSDGRSVLLSRRGARALIYQLRYAHFGTAKQVSERDLAVDFLAERTREECCSLMERAGELQSGIMLNLISDPDEWESLRKAVIDSRKQRVMDHGSMKQRRKQKKRRQVRKNRESREGGLNESDHRRLSRIERAASESPAPPPPSDPVPRDIREYYHRKNPCEEWSTTSLSSVIRRTDDLATKTRKIYRDRVMKGCLEEERRLRGKQGRNEDDHWTLESNKRVRMKDKVDTLDAWSHVYSFQTEFLLSEGTAVWCCVTLLWLLMVVIGLGICSLMWTRIFDSSVDVDIPVLSMKDLLDEDYSVLSHRDRSESTGSDHSWTVIFNLVFMLTVSVIIFVCVLHPCVLLIGTLMEMTVHSALLVKLTEQCIPAEQWSRVWPLRSKARYFFYLRLFQAYRLKLHYRHSYLVSSD